METFTSLRSTAEDDYISEEDEDYLKDDDDLVDAVSQLSMDDDEYSYDTVTTAFKSVSSKRGEERNKKTRPAEGSSFSGLTNLGLPYILDIWRDNLCRKRISVQLHLLSGDNDWKEIKARVSTSQRELVITLPMSPYLARSDLAFGPVALQEPRIASLGQQNIVYLLKNHSKTHGRMYATGVIKDRKITKDFFYEQRIPLPRKVDFKWAQEAAGDDIFYGTKFVLYEGGAQFLHIEMVVDTPDTYCPEECLLDPAMMVTQSSPVPGKTGETQIIGRELGDGENEARREAKRMRDATEANSVHSQNYSMGGATTYTNPAGVTRDGTREEQEYDARKHAEAVMKKVDAAQKSLMDES